MKDADNKDRKKSKNLSSVKNKEDVKTFSKSKADGIVLGSAIIKKIQEKCHETRDKHIVANFIKSYCKELIENLNK